jgi:hypothetical protein
MVCRREVVRLQADRFPAFHSAFILVTGIAKRGTEFAVGVRVIWLESNSPPILLDGRFEATIAPMCHAKFEVDCSVVSGLAT